MGCGRGSCGEITDVRFDRSRPVANVTSANGVGLIFDFASLRRDVTLATGPGLVTFATVGPWTGDHIFIPRFLCLGKEIKPSVADP